MTKRTKGSLTTRKTILATMPGGLEGSWTIARTTEAPHIRGDGQGSDLLEVDQARVNKRDIGHNERFIQERLVGVNSVRL